MDKFLVIYTASTLFVGLCVAAVSIYYRLSPAEALLLGLCCGVALPFIIAIKIEAKWDEYQEKKGRN
ncbi:hypothetical protein [Cloacibacillus porcorum]